MLNRVKTARIKDIAKETIYSNSEYLHAIYGLCYLTEAGNIVEELADNKSEIRFYTSDNSFNESVDKIHHRYESIGCEYINIYSVHK